MSVYVDPPIAYAREPRGYVGRARIAHRWAHMIADAEAELHAMAQAVGLRREWCQGDHYDLVPSRRALAVRLGAVALDRRAFGAKLRQLRTGARMRRRACCRGGDVEQGTTCSTPAGKPSVHDASAGLHAGSSPAASTK